MPGWLSFLYARMGLIFQCMVALLFRYQGGLPFYRPVWPSLLNSGVASNLEAKMNIYAGVASFFMFRWVYYLLFDLDCLDVEVSSFVDFGLAIFLDVGVTLLFDGGVASPW